jgi:hypothetical protein
MPKRILPLSDSQVRDTKAKENSYKLFDGFGLYLLVTPSGGKLWRVKYRFDGKEKTLSLGPYPQVSLKDARAKREAARIQIGNGVDPGVVNRAVKRAIAAEIKKLKTLAREWHPEYPNK